MKRFAKLLLIAFFLIGLFPVSVSADMGPKPSVEIDFEGLPEGQKVYAAFLADQESYGPQHEFSREELKGVHKDEKKLEAALAFYDKAKEEGLYFWGDVYEVGNDEPLSMHYYPPETFKVAVYDGNGTVRVSALTKKTAFDSLYTLNVSTMEIRENPQTLKTILGFLARCFITIVVEVLIGLIFGFRKKEEVRFIILTNFFTQVFLNAVLTWIAYYEGGMVWLIFFPLSEIVVFLLEGIIYTVRFRKTHRWWLIWLYALFANGITAYIGLFAYFLL